MDPYVYDNSPILINKLNIKDEQQLIDIDTINGANEYFPLSYGHGKQYR